MKPENKTGLNRKYLIRVLHHPRPKRERKRRERQAEQSAAVAMALMKIRGIFEQPCRQRL